jgi:OmpA-OmpF porin, OOP family
MRALGLLLGATVVLFAQRAHATDCSGITSSCIDDDNFWPHAGPSKFVAVGGTETVGAAQLGFGLVTTYLSRPIILTVPSPSPLSPTKEYAINDQVNGSFLWAYGVTKRLEMDLALPVTFGQGGTGSGPVSGGPSLHDTAMRDLRLGLAYALIPNARVAPTLTTNEFALTARFEGVLPTGDRSQFAGEGAFVWAPSIAASYRVTRFLFGAEVGARIRKTAEIIGARVGSQASIAVGAGYEVLDHEHLTVLAEARALPTFTEQNGVEATANGLVSTPNGSHIAPAEWMLSVRTSPVKSGDFAIQAGGGGSIPLSSDEAITNPRFRFTLSLRYAPLARDSDHDGVTDGYDKCPNEVGSGSPRDGCPHAVEPSGPPPVPAAVLHLRGKDVCTSDPDMVDGFTNDAGCPDEDSDKDGVDDRFDKCPLASEDNAGLRDGCPEGQKR